MRIRALEELLLELYRRDLLFGTVHTCVGQEFCASALHPHLDPGRDAFFGSHRCHGHYLAYGGPLDGFLAELMGRQGGVCGGRGGSQHLHHGRFFSSGIQGGTAVLATGFAWGLRLRGEAGIAVAQIGDGTLGQGVVYESLTFASLLAAPVLYLLEWNGYAQSTDVRTTTPGDVDARLRGFGVEVWRASDRDPEALSTRMADAVAQVRQGVPTVLIVETRRLLAHSKGDDDRPRDILARLRGEDPLCRHLQHQPDAAARLAAIREQLAGVAEGIVARPLAPPRASSAVPAHPSPPRAERLHADLEPAGSGRIVERLNGALHELMAADERVVCLGEDLADPYGGAFKVTRGLSTRFPRRVFSTPISEAAIAGVANGVALAGGRPVAELMFGDFVLLAADQLLNHAAKFFYMYNEQTCCPITVRLVSGGGRGYGPTHSQSLEHLLCTVPGLRVVALSRRHDPAELLKLAVQDDAPTVLVENKLLYAMEPAAQLPFNLEPWLASPSDRGSGGGGLAPLRYRPQGGRHAEITLVTFGGMTDAVETAMRALFVEEEFEFDYLVLTQLAPLDVGPIVASVRRTGHLLVVEEAPSGFGVGAAVIAAVCQALSDTPPRCRSVGAGPIPIPSARHLEAAALPCSDDVVRAALSLRTGAGRDP